MIYYWKFAERVCVFFNGVMVPVPYVWSEALALDYENQKTQSKVKLFEALKELYVCEECTVNLKNDKWCTELLIFVKELHDKYLKGKWNRVFHPFINFSTSLKESDLTFCFSIYAVQKSFSSSEVNWAMLTRPYNTPLGTLNVDFIGEGDQRVEILTRSPYGNQTPTSIKDKGSVGTSTCECPGGYVSSYPGYYNVFVKNAGTCFSEYLSNLFNDSNLHVTLPKFTCLFKFLVRQMYAARTQFPDGDFTLDNHNQEVGILHFKYMNRKCTTNIKIQKDIK
jgi:hypothetical protein